jgi:hypothetical protein
VLAAIASKAVLAMGSTVTRAPGRPQASGCRPRRGESRDGRNEPHWRGGHRQVIICRFRTPDAKASDVTETTQSGGNGSVPKIRLPRPNTTGKTRHNVRRNVTKRCDTPESEGLLVWEARAASCLLRCRDRPGQALTGARRLLCRSSRDTTLVSASFRSGCEWPFLVAGALPRLDALRSGIQGLPSTPPHVRWGAQSR